jgi:DNA-binding phage protein
MTEQPKEISLYAERESTLKGKLGLSAAMAAANIARLLHAAKAGSGLTSKDIAQKLEVSEGRVSQVLSGDGNVHIATVARFVRAMGYELQISAVPVDAGRGPLNLIGRRSRRKSKVAEKTFEVFLQTFLTHEGPVKVPMVVPAHDTMLTTPHGNPTAVAKFRVSSRGNIRRIPMRTDVWRTETAVDVNRVEA